jgi:hypothetical protein
MMRQGARYGVRSQRSGSVNGYINRHSAPINQYTSTINAVASAKSAPSKIVTRSFSKAATLSEASR